MSYHLKYIVFFLAIGFIFQYKAEAMLGDKDPSSESGGTPTLTRRPPPRDFNYGIDPSPASPSPSLSRPNSQQELYIPFVLGEENCVSLHYPSQFQAPSGVTGFLKKYRECMTPPLSESRDHSGVLKKSGSCLF